jgi:hypothetical protein
MEQRPTKEVLFVSRQTPHGTKWLQTTATPVVFAPELFSAGESTAPVSWELALNRMSPSQVKPPADIQTGPIYHLGGIIHAEHEPT